jgi:hypothetical protein
VPITDPSETEPRCPSIFVPVLFLRLETRQKLQFRSEFREISRPNKLLQTKASACQFRLTDFQPHTDLAHLFAMPPKKKSKKPASNPARGFATTSIASKPRVQDPAEASASPNIKKDVAKDSPAAPAGGTAPTETGNAAQPTTATAESKTQTQHLSPEEFEKQLEESQLQLLVEKHVQKVRRDALRQKTRLETDRRLLRNAAEPLNTKKWLPPELMDHILDLIQAEARFAASGVSSEGATSKLPPEEDLIVRLWTLQETLQATGFPEDKIQPALQHILDIAPNIAYNTRSESIWGLEEVLDWFARECVRDELPDYSGRNKTGAKSQPGTGILPKISDSNSDDCLFRNPYRHTTSRWYSSGVGFPERPKV